MKFSDCSRTPSGPVPAWFHSVPTPSTFSPLWVLERMSMLGMPLSLIGLIAAATHFGWIAN